MDKRLERRCGTDYISADPKGTAGGVEFGATYPCQRFRIPEGFETVEVTLGM